MQNNHQKGIEKYIGRFQLVHDIDLHLSTFTQDPDAQSSVCQMVLCFYRMFNKNTLIFSYPSSSTVHRTDAFWPVEVQAIPDRFSQKQIIAREPSSHRTYLIGI